MKPKNNKLAEWRLTRERFHISDPFPPRPRKPEQKIGAILSELQGLEPATETLPELLEARWAIIVGEQIAQHTRPASLRGSILYIYADHPGWLAEVKRHPTQHLLKKIASIPNIPEIKTIRFQLDPSIRTRRR